MTDFRKIVESIRVIADGRRHYDGTEGYTCFEALGDIRTLCDASLGDVWVEQAEQKALDRINEFLDHAPPVRVDDGFYPEGGNVPRGPRPDRRFTGGLDDL